MPATSSVVRFPKHLRYGDLVFDTNTLLSKVALRSGDRKNAARHLFAAAETPGSDRLRYNPISIELPRSLIDRDEREASHGFWNAAPGSIRTEPAHAVGF